MRNSFSNNVQTFSLPQLVTKISLSALFFLCATATTAAVAQTPKDNAQHPAPSAKSDQATPANDQTRARRTASASSSSADKPSSSATQESNVEKGMPRLDQLRAQINAATSSDERARLQHTLVDYLVALNRKSEAVAELRLMMREDRFDPAGFYNIGNDLARLGDSNTAVDAYRKAINQRRGNYARALNNMGVVLMRLDRLDEARQAFTDALRQEGFRYAEASYNLGRLYAMRGETKAAIQEWRRTTALDPNDAAATLSLARSYAGIGNTTQALAVLDTYTKRNGASNEFATARKEILSISEAATVEPKKVNAPKP